jgi:cardiolipin synthase
MDPVSIWRSHPRVVVGALAGVAALGGGLAAGVGSTVAASASPSVVISEVYGGGGDSGATYENDFIELVNRSSSAISVNGWSVQYHSSSKTSTSWSVTDLSGSIPANGVYLVSEAAGSGGTKALPTAQASGTIDLSATAGTVALLNSTTALSTADSTTAVADSQDLVGYGATAIAEGSPAAAPSDTTSVQRTGASGNNAADFSTGAPTPGSSSLTGTGTTTTGTTTTPTTTTGTTTTGTTGTTTTPTGTTPTLITEPDQGLTPIYNYLQSATKSIDMTMYALQDTQAEDLLGDEAAKGITVRVILDGSSNEKTNNTPAYNYLSAHGVQVVWSNPAYTYTHEKSIVVDDTSVAIMTLNLQSQYYSTSRDFAVIDHDASDVKAVEAVFNADFKDASITPSDGDDLVWSPTDSQTQLLALINNASSSLVVENEEMDDTDITNALASAAKRGVDVEVIMTDDDGDYDSEFNTLTAAGVHVVTYAESASLYIHAKVILADGKRAFIGSENFSNTSLNENRELGLITTNSAILSSLQSTLASDYSGATPYTS